MSTQTNNLLLLETGLARTVSPSDNLVLDAFLEDPNIGITVTSGEAFAIGDLITLYNDGGTLKAFKSDATDNTSDRKYVTGVALEAASGAGELKRVVSMAGSKVPVNFTAAPATANNGDAVYLSLTAGKATLTAPTTIGQTVHRVGILEGADGSSNPVNVKFLPAFVSDISSGGSGTTDTSAFQTYVLTATTTDATVTELTIGGGAPSGLTNTLAVPVDTTIHYNIQVVVRNQTTDGENAAYQISVVAKRDASVASTSIVNTQYKVIVADEDAAPPTGWDFNTAIENTTYGYLKLQATGEAASTLKWTAYVTSIQSVG